MNQLHLISKYRYSLMGFATLWIISFHALTKLKLQEIPILKFSLWPGFGGVDIFLFLSGFGLYYASLNMKTKSYFYLKRFIRIFPAYFFICLLDSFTVADYSISHFVAKVTTIGYWFNYNYFDWYVPSLVIFYLLFPLYIGLFNKHPYRSTIVASLIGLGLTLIYVAIDVDTGAKLILFFIRIPVFFIGVLVGKLSLDKNLYLPYLKEVSLLLVIIGFISFFFFDNISYFAPYLWKGLLWIPFILIAPSIAFILSYLFDTYMSKIASFLSFFGKISFELFLIHVLLFKLIGKSPFDFMPTHLQLFFVLGISIIGSILLHKMCNAIALPILKNRN